jgi:hypothetical protein
MKRYLVLLLVVVMFLVLSTLSFAADECIKGQVCKDAKGFYILNDLGSKGRISAKDLELKKQNLPYGIVYEANDLSEQETQKMESDRIVAEQKKALILEEQAKQKLINDAMQDMAIKKLQDTGILDAKGEIVEQ